MVIDEFFYDGMFALRFIGMMVCDFPLPWLRYVNVVSKISLGKLSLSEFAFINHPLHLFQCVIQVAGTQSSL